MSYFRVTDEQVSEFDEHGLLVVPGLLNAEETELLGRIARADRDLVASSYGRADGEGGTVKLLVENEVTDDFYGAVVRCERIVRNVERLLRDEVYHWHHKMILKEPRVGGAWAWHQDYGYWYDNGCLAPDLASCMVAVDRATRENGCLQVVRGSHRLGRITHGPVGDQTGADPERVAVAVERMELVHVELEPGSAVFFHSNLLHRSDQNTSNHPRWAFICCYNTRTNSPYKETRHPEYTPLDVLPDEELAGVGHDQLRTSPHTGSV